MKSKEDIKRVSASKLKTWKMCPNLAYHQIVLNNCYSESAALLDGTFAHMIVEGREETARQFAIDNRKNFLLTSGEYNAKTLTLLEKALKEKNRFENSSLVKNAISVQYEQKMITSENNVDELDITYELIGIVDAVIRSDQTPGIQIVDWKFLKNFKRVYDQTTGSYEEFYDTYRNQLLIYMYLAYKKGLSGLQKEEPVTASLRCVSKSTKEFKTYELTALSYKDLVGSDSWINLQDDIQNFLLDMQSENRPHCMQCEACYADDYYEDIHGEL